MSNSEQSPPTTEEVKRPFQFSLRTMFVATFVWATLCAIGATFGLGWAFLVAGLGLVGGGIYCRFHDHTKAGKWLVVLGILMTLILGILMPVALGVRETFQHIGCRTNVKLIGIAMHQYEEVHGSFPPAYIADESGDPMHSWRVLLLPFLDRNDIYKKYDFDEPWDGPNNSKLHNLVVEYYKCPRDGPHAKDTDTSYVVVVGPNTMFPGAESVRFKDFTDDTSTTIMAVEVKNSGIHWMEPRDLHVVQMAPTANPSAGQGISGNHGGARAVMADGTFTRIIGELHTPEQIEALLTPNGGEEVDLDEF